MGATLYMCPHKTLFVKYEKMSGTRDHRLLSIDEFGSIILRMCDGVVETIQYWYVLGIKMSLIVGVDPRFSRVGYHVRHKVLKVCRDSITFIRGRWTDGDMFLMRL